LRSGRPGFGFEPASPRPAACRIGPAGSHGRFATGPWRRDPELGFEQRPIAVAPLVRPAGLLARGFARPAGETGRLAPVCPAGRDSAPAAWPTAPACSIRRRAEHWPEPGWYAASL